MQETVHTLRSDYLQNERQIWVRTPADATTARCLTIFLDGELYRDRVGASSVIDALYQDTAIADSWFVFVSMQSVEARWRECPCHPPFARFIAEELLPWLEGKHPQIRAADQRTLIGLSYTGLAAAYVAIERPGLFQKVISQSGSFWFDDCRLVRQLPHRTLPTAFYLDVGRQETTENVQHREDVLQVVSQIEAVRRFRDVLQQHGHAVTYVEFDGGHDFASWRQTLPDALRWALPAP